MISDITAQLMGELAEENGINLLIGRTLKPQSCRTSKANQYKTD